MAKVVSLTPAVFHLPEAVNEVSRTYGVNPIVPRKTTSIRSSMSWMH